MPAMTILYILNYLDRQNIAASNLADITVDLGLSVTQYNTTVSILFVGYSKYAPIATKSQPFLHGDGASGYGISACFGRLPEPGCLRRRQSTSGLVAFRCRSL